MEIQAKPTRTREKDVFEFANHVGSSNSDLDTQKRLDALLAANLEIQRDKEIFPTERERFEASLMKNPITIERAFSYLGAMLGLFPPFAIFSKFAFSLPHKADPGMIAVMVIMNIICVVTGYFSGKLIGKLVAPVEKMSWMKMLLLLPFIGILWGIMTGAAGGVIVFIIGAFFGAIVAAAVGAVAVPAFTIFHRLLKKGDLMEEKHFFPVALGITCAITALILGW